MAAVMNMHGGEGNTLHPFFTRPNAHDGSHIAHENKSASNDNEVATNEKLYDEDNAESTTQPKTKSRTRKPKQHGSRIQGQKTLAEVLNPPGAEAALPSQLEEKLQDRNVTWDQHEDDGPRKRRRTNSFDINTMTNASAAMSNPTCNPTEIPKQNASPHVSIPPPNTVEADATQQARSMPPPTTPPKKMMKLNAGGKLSSPGGKAKDDAKQPDIEPRRRGRPRKVKEPEPPKSLVVVIRYAAEYATEKRLLLGQRLVRILEGDERIPEPVPVPKKQGPSKKIKPTKPTHPFFSGKSDDKTVPRQRSPPRMSASTPGKLRSQTFHDRIPEPARDVPNESALLKDRLMVRHPGAREALWPDRTQAHVRGLGDEPVVSAYSYAPNKQKRKQFKGVAESSMSTLDGFATFLEPEAEPAQRSDGFAGPRDDLRLPDKLLMSGRDVMKRVAKELRSAVQQSDEDELSGSLAVQSQVPLSCVQKLYSALPNHLSAFDNCSGDTLGWTQKYAPTAAQDVLQTGGKMAILKDWLQSLKVNTVEAAPSAQPAPKTLAKPKKKRRRQNDDLDDFLVDDDAGFYEMDDVPDVMEVDEPPSKNQLKSIVQASNVSKVSNAVLLSGPHGCGKTASAYAVAKELGYQVFEISSAERRSGRDVVDRVGDMTENHIVRHHGVDPGEVSASEDRSQLEAAFQKDLESGRQGKMSAFFKKQPEVKPKAPKVQQLRTKTVEKLQKALKQPTKDQQQSLILLEEVDVLFKEDKEFWTTIFRLLASSKRPFIMTCNDEDLVPYQAMSLHAILRYAPPPVDPSVDLMLLIAAMEGHLLKREAVASLFASKNHDLRASIAELDFWCQMGVGDPKGGLSWIYQRYPPGSDVDQHGEKLRLISEGTYHDGMGLVQPAASVDEDALLLAWREFGVEISDVMGLADCKRTAECLQAATTALPSSLKDMSKMADSLSATDVYSTHDSMDASLPEAHLKLRASYIEGMALLDSNEKIDYSDTPARIAITSAVLACTSFTSEAAASDHLAPSNLLRCIQNAGKEGDVRLTRRDFACFDMISMPSSASTNGGLELSAFDGPLSQLSTDLAPYVRSIAQYDLSLEEQRERLGEVMKDGHKAKRARTTRAARSALEGSQRGSTRRERWFTKELDLDAVLATGGSDWSRTSADLRSGETREGSEAPASSIGSAVSTPREQ